MSRMKNFFVRAERRLYIEIKKRRLKNKNASLITDNCIGGIICHDMNMRFNSPTVNLWLKPGDFIKLLQNPQNYFGVAPVEVFEDGIDYPIGEINGIRLYFMHYQSFENAKAKWLERSARIDYYNVYIIMTDKNNCSREHIQAFDALPYRHKILLSHLDLSRDYECVHYIKGFEDCDEVGTLTDFKPGLKKRRYIDSFDYVNFLNSRD